LTVASEKQIAANRRNATKSTGPRSGAGKKRAAHNAYRHGLTLSASSAALAQQVEKLGLQIAGNMQDEIALDLARAAAAAMLELERVRRVKLAMIERASAFGGLVVPKRFRTANAEVRWLIAMERWRHRGKGLMPSPPQVTDPVATMPSQEPERSAEAIRRVLPELIKLYRYESRAVARRDRAIRKLSAWRIKSEEPARQISQTPPVAERTARSRKGALAAARRDRTV
jgi:hypothetical protein